MTNEDILLPEGFEDSPPLPVANHHWDCEVATKVLGWVRHASSLDRTLGWTGNGKEWDHTPKFTKDIAAAWMVVDLLRTKFTNVSLHGANGWGLTCWNIDADGNSKDIVAPINADTPALAICRVALLWAWNKQ